MLKKIFFKIFLHIFFALGAASKKKKIGTFGWWRPKKYQFFFWFHSMQKPSKRVNTHKKKFIWVYHPIPLSSGAVNLSKVTVKGG